jgi:3-oxoacyl-[acyl-carrier protein] reductase
VTTELTTRPAAIVTGGSRGIGRAIVLRLTGAGVHVRFTFLHAQKAADDLVEEVARAGGSADAVRVDSRDVGATAAMVESAISDRGRLDVLVNNAAIRSDRLLMLMDADQWSEVIETSLNGLFGATKRATREMMRQRRGRIINLTSVSGLVGIAGQTHYSAAKAAIIGFTRSLAKEVAGVGVSVNAVAPGFVETDMLSTLTPEQRKVALERVPMRRFATAEEIAGFVGYLALEAPQYLTGQVLVIDGGLSS